MEEPRILSDRYALISHLARGGMADVWIAEDHVLGRRVAIKILHRQFAEDPAFVERFRRESQAAAGLSHPNVVAVHDWGRDGDTYFIVMEFVQGRDLGAVIRSEGTLPAERVTKIGSAVGMALSAAHNQGLVHRDIKPANVLLTPEGAVKVADFGIARARHDSEQLTQTGAVVGTAAYFSPEQAQGHPADPRSDIYSLGVVMYELLTGVPPFSGENSLAIAYQHIQRVPDPPSRLKPDVPPELEAIVLKAMAKDPADRYQTAAEMVEDLDRLRAGETPQAALHRETPTRVMPPVVGLPPMPSRSRDSYDPPLPYHRGAVGAVPRTFKRTARTVGVIAAAALLLLGIFLAVRLAGPGGESTLVLPEGTGDTTTVTDPGSSTEPSAADAITLPTVNSPENQTAAAGVSTSFDLGSFNDPGGDEGPWGIEVRWVDGESFESLGTSDTAGPLGTASHTYASAGSYTVTVRVTDKGSASGVAAFTVTVSADRMILYLHNDPTPPTGSTYSQARLPMDSTAPTATTLHNYDADRDDFPGLLIKKGGSEDRYIFPDEDFQNWRYTAPPGGLVLAGNVEVTLFSAMKDFTADKYGYIQVYLRDCTGNSCTTIASGSLERRQWNDASGWSEDTIVLSGLSYTVAAGRQLELKIVVHDDSDDDMWFAYDTTTHPARLTWTN